MLWNKHSLSEVKPVSYIPKQIKNNEVNLVDFLNNININFSNISKDGRINSCLYEDNRMFHLNMSYNNGILTDIFKWNILLRFFINKKLIQFKWNILLRLLFYNKK